MNKKKKFEAKIKKSILYLTFVVLLCIFISLLYIITLVINHYESFERNPLIFGANKYEVNSCSCVGDNGNPFNFNKEKIWVENENKNNIEFNLSSAEFDKLIIE